MSKGNKPGAGKKKEQEKVEMKTIEIKNEEAEIVPEEIVPQSGHAKMPLFLLVIWIINVAFFLFYFIRYGLPDLEQWLSR